MDLCEGKMIEMEERKIQSVLLIQKYFLEPVKKLLRDTSGDMPFQVIERHRFYLLNNKRQLASLNDALLNNRCINNEVKSDVEKTIQDLKEVIPLLEQRIEMYQKSFAQKNNDIDISNLSRCFHDPQSFQQIIKDILVVYEIPLNNLHYGEVIRSVLTDLNKAYNTHDFFRIHGRVKHCKKCLENLEEELEVYPLQSYKDDLCRVRKSLVKLLEMCEIVIASAEKETKT